jgi:hypothetical protein
VLCIANDYAKFMSRRGRDAQGSIWHAPAVDRWPEQHVQEVFRLSYFLFPVGTGKCRRTVTGPEIATASDVFGSAGRQAEKAVAMIQLRFNSMAGTDPAILGPAPFFTIDGPLLQQGPGREVVGRYFDHHWELGGRYVSSYECSGAVRVHFEGRAGEVSGPYGPFQHVRFPNGSCYADQALLAELVEERAYWVHRADLTKWPVIVISPARSA